ncbi:type II toxin-antitoxin system RelE/ParE family toxin [Lichenibacterium dinghuense]|uniref:type II toxin-antitoxin system RelE/ParE family toxin n=1 Tax=Lichenibacterium dinghuense TaxID=2895977 RepID=UPI001F3621BC|nr:type II toxin-antitoxin system RelE/ParE family toxin [Lichenibacterium sp. 6Y81]
MTTLPGNLTPQARQDLRKQLRRSRETFGPVAALKLSSKLLARFRLIEAGKAIGHVRHDLPFAEPTLCLTVSPLLVIYNPHTCLVLRVVDGRRDLTALTDE